MAKNKKTEQVEEVVEETVEVEESTANDLFTNEVTEKVKVKLLKNIKYNTSRYKIGEEIEIDAGDKESFIKAGIIAGE